MLQKLKEMMKDLHCSDEYGDEYYNDAISDVYNAIEKLEENENG